MGAAEVGAAAADAAQVHVGLGRGGFHSGRTREDVEAVAVLEAAVIVLGVDVGLVEGRSEVLAGGHRRAEALCMVRESDAIARTRQLAETFAQESREALTWLPDSPYRTALLELPDFVLSRLY